MNRKAVQRIMQLKGWQCHRRLKKRCSPRVESSSSVTQISNVRWLSKAKIHVADGLGSRALRADAAEAITCGYLPIVVVVGLVAQALFHAWWVDGVTSLAIVYFLVKEGREAWEGDDCNERARP